MRSAVRKLALLVCVLQLAIAADKPAAHVRNFGQVNDHIYRGGEPSLVGLQELGAMGIKMVVDLRETSAATDFEKHEAEKLGMKYVNVPLPPLSAPTLDEVERVLSILTQDKSDPIFVHCRRGKDRTGTVIACYRIQHDGWDNRQALDEAKKYGISLAERGMRSYILHFSPQAASAASKPVM